MKLLQELSAQVLLGTERRPPILPPVDGALGELLTAACPPDTGAEVRILRTAGAVATCADAGFLPGRSPQDLPAPCPPDDLPLANEPPLVAALSQILGEGPDPMRDEALRRLAARGLALPPALLPTVLALGQKNPSLRPLLPPVLGRRGRWLAQINPAWSYAAGNLDGGAYSTPDEVAGAGVWDEGTLEQRGRFLGRLRTSDPARARELLQKGFADLDARERASLLASLEIDLAPADEDFLESLLNDRSKEVRQSAANLLACLPGSRYLGRMGERMATCLRSERKLFRQVWVLDAPPQFGTGWKSDALEETRAKNESLGERAWWLYQVARALPLPWWAETTGLTPAELIKWLQGTDWSAALLRAWGEALRRRPDARWAAALLASLPLKGLPLDVFDLLACLPVSEREPHWLRMLDAGPRTIAQGDLLGRIVQGVRAGEETLSAGFCSRVLKELRGTVKSDQGKWDYALRKSLPDFVCLLPAACLADVASGWPAGQPDTEYFSETLARVLAIVEQRKTLQRFL